FDFTVRLNDAIAQQHVIIKTSIYNKSLIENLAKKDTRSDIQLDLLSVVKHELLEISPNLSN
ncbi:AraC family transcriptional regulator, partial [Vibrio parahaemolyticus]|nr:AraC family transcriptional regulator [Vibrio parahaemolyticus]